MITITRGTVNTVILTLTENATLTSPVFLFEFVNDQTREAYCLIASDQSQFPYRYNAFLISEQADADPLSGEVSLPVPGDYHYSVYEQSSATNLDPAQATGWLESGKLTVLSSDTDAPVVYDSEPQTNIVYQG